MQTNVEKLSSIKRKINFEIPAQKVSAAVDKAYAEIRKHAAIKGFRKGKVPMSLIEKHYGHQMADDVVKQLVSDTYFSAVNEQGLNPVGYPVIESDQLKPGESFKYSATVEVFPEVELKEYTGLELQKEKAAIDNEAAVSARLKELQENMAQLGPAPEGHAAALGDFVTFDFKGSIDGVPFEGGAAEDYQLELGSGRFIPGFEDQMVGMKVGETKTLTVTFPENYGNAELAGKPADFEVSVKEIKAKEFPELNDDFAKEFGEEFETLDQLKAKLAEVNQAQEEQRLNNELRDRLVKALIEKNDFEVPEALVDRQLASLLESSKQRLAAQRLTLEMMGLTEEAYKVQFKESARDQVKGSLLLDAVADKEKIEVSEDDIKARIESMAKGAGQDVEKVESFYEGNQNAKESLIAHMREEKAMDFVLSKATISEVPKEEIK
jgi:trigger factor